MSFSIKIFILFLAVSLRAASPTDLFTWPGGVATNGPYTLVSVVTNYTVIQPNGSEPSSNSLASHRYRHHTRIAYRDGVIYLAYNYAMTILNSRYLSQQASAHIDDIRWYARALSTNEINTIYNWRP